MQTIYLDISNKGIVPTIYAKQGDVGRKFEVILTDSGLPYIPVSGSAFSVWYDGASGEGNYTDIGDNSAFSLTGNKVTVEMISQMISNHGDGILCLVLSDPNGNQISTWNIPYICEHIPGANSEEARSYYTAFSRSVQELSDTEEILRSKLSVDGSNAMEDNLPMGGYRVTGLAAPEASTDAVTKAYVDDGFAPAGYGLGSADSKHLSTADDLNNCAENGFYSWESAPINAPFYNGIMIVATYDWARKVQYIWSAENGYAVQRIQFGASWSEPEWVNPPMILGVEYRTTERWNGHVVYTRLVNCGIVANGATVNIDGVTACVRFFGYISPLSESALRKQLPVWSGETIGTGYHAEVTQSTGAYNTSQFIIKTDSVVDSYGNGGYIWFVQAWYTKD